jgi:hypothetical protein
MCKNCTYRCSVCETETRETGSFIVTDDQVFCETCFRCYRCRKRLYVGDGEAPPARMQNTDSPLYSYHCADCVKEASKKQKIKHKKKQSDVVQEMAGSGAAGRSASSSKTTLAQDKSALPTTGLNVPDLVIQNSPNQPSRMISNPAAKPFGPVLLSTSIRDPSVEALLSSIYLHAEKPDHDVDSNGS